jgi:hypothetical protein
MFHMTSNTKKLLERLASWPEEDITELEEAAREIEARRAGVYVATPEELQAVDEADRSGVATDAEVEAAFRAFRRA